MDALLAGDLLTAAKIRVHVKISPSPTERTANSVQYVVRLAMNNATGAGQWSEEVEMDTVANPAQRILNELMAPESEPVLEDLAELRTFHGGLYNAMKKSVKEHVHKRFPTLVFFGQRDLRVTQDGTREILREFCLFNSFFRPTYPPTSCNYKLVNSRRIPDSLD